MNEMMHEEDGTNGKGIMLRPVAQAVVNIEDAAMNPAQIIRQVALIQTVLHQVMKDGEHFGVIPGTGNKPSLLKPGAEKLSLTFRLSPSYRIERVEYPGGHREYIVHCSLTHIPTGTEVGQGVGSCSTLEAKYRFRTGPAESTGRPVPKDYWALRDKDPAGAKKLLGGPGYSAKKVDGSWEIVQQGEKVEHDNPADYYNTVLKMAKKRAHVDAILTATAASDIFTQDVEDLAANGVLDAGAVPAGNGTQRAPTHGPASGTPQSKSTGAAAGKPGADTSSVLEEVRKEAAAKGLTDADLSAFCQTSYKADLFGINVGQLRNLLGKVKAGAVAKVTPAATGDELPFDKGPAQGFDPNDDVPEDL